MKNKRELSQFLSEELGGIPPNNIFNALIRWENKTILFDLGKQR